MSLNYSVRYAAHPGDVKTYNTQRLRDDFLIKDLFTDGDITLTYSHYDRYIVGGAKPGKESLELTTIDPLKSDHFLDRREMGIVNVGGTGNVIVDSETYDLDYKEALYIGKGAEEISFNKADGQQPLFYINSAPAHHSYPNKKITRDDAEIVELGSLDTSNHRVIRKLFVYSTVETCQLQMGMTELKEGNV